MTLRTQIQRIDKDLPIPRYETTGAAAFDIMARETVEIEAGAIGLVPGNVIVKVPDGYMLILVPRSSTPRKKGLLIPHGIGVIDMDYHGPEDELKVQVMNFTKEKVVVERGERIAQAIFVKIDRFEFEEVEQIKEESRGGFGSTG